MNYLKLNVTLTVVLSVVSSVCMFFLLSACHDLQTALTVGVPALQDVGLVFLSSMQMFTWLFLCAGIVISSGILQLIFVVLNFKRSKKLLLLNGFSFALMVLFFILICNLHLA